MAKTTGLRNSLGGWISARACSSWSAKHHLPGAEPRPGTLEPVIYHRECYQRCLSATAGKVNTAPVLRAGYHLAGHKGDTSTLGKPPPEIAAAPAAKQSTIPGDWWHGRASRVTDPRRGNYSRESTRLTMQGVMLEQVGCRQDRMSTSRWDERGAGAHPGARGDGAAAVRQAEEPYQTSYAPRAAPSPPVLP